MTRTIQHFTENFSPSVFEQKGGHYILENGVKTSPTVKEGFIPYNYFNSPGYAPVTIYNNWPKCLQNASIFSYLVEDKYHSSDKEFSDFVKQWYQTSCAILYWISDKNYAIIGTGCLVGKTIIGTARHVFNDLPLQSLRVRFFNYQVSAHPRGLKINEDFIDFPVVESFFAGNGVDAGYLKIPVLKSYKIFNTYAKILPTSLADILGGGEYAMFHFAGGLHQISIGEISTPGYGMNLHNEIRIQAGPGASGAGIIRKDFSQVRGYGISIYRLMRSGIVERRLISFNQFFGNPWLDQITAPYHRDNLIVTSEAQRYDRSGPEFIFWDKTRWGLRMDHPSHKMYKSIDEKKQANHHIIPIDDLLYVWDYFHTLDQKAELEIKREADKEGKKYEQNEMDKFDKEIKEFYPAEEQEGMKKKELPTIQKKIARQQKTTYDHLHKEKMQALYKEVQVLLYELCKPNVADKIWFAWSWWNLFQGWNRTHRKHHDPFYDTTGDRSEKVKPKSFDVETWKCLKDSKDGIYAQIQNLKKTKVPDVMMEKNLKDSLHALNEIWKKRGVLGTQKIHSYIDSEWECLGGVYKIAS